MSQRLEIPLWRSGEITLATLYSLTLSRHKSNSKGCPLRNQNGFRTETMKRYTIMQLRLIKRMIFEKTLCPKNLTF